MCAAGALGIAVITKTFILLLIKKSMMIQVVSGEIISCIYLFKYNITTVRLKVQFYVL